MKTLEQKIRRTIADYWEDEGVDNPEILVKMIMSVILQHNLQEQYKK